MTTLVLRYADVGVATYATLRVVGAPERTVSWVVEEPLLLAALGELAAAVPEPLAGESVPQALVRACARGALADPVSELTLAYRLGVLLIAPAAWRLLEECLADPRADLFVAPSARLGQVPWGQLARPAVVPDPLDLLRARSDGVTADGPRAAPIAWPDVDIAALTEGYRLMELAEVAMAVPTNLAVRRRDGGSHLAGEQAVLVLDPRVPGQRADSPLGSVLGRPSAETPLSRYFATVMEEGPTLPAADDAVELFRRTDVDRRWLAAALAQRPARMLFVGHVSAADGAAEQAALHLACRADLPGLGQPLGEHRPLLVRDLLELDAPIPPRVALLACASAGDYRFDEATGLVAAMVLGGAELVTATLWPLPTSEGFRLSRPDTTPTDPMADVVIAVDRAHRADGPGGAREAARAVNRWQRAQLRRWRDGDRDAHPLYWASLVSFRFGEEWPR